MGDRMFRLSPEIKKIRCARRCFYACIHSKIRIKTKHVESYRVLSPDQGSTPCSSTREWNLFTQVKRFCHLKRNQARLNFSINDKIRSEIVRFYFDLWNNRDRRRHSLGHRLKSKSIWEGVAQVMGFHFFYLRINQTHLNFSIKKCTRECSTVNRFLRWA